VIRSRPAVLFWQLAILVALLAIWEYGFDLARAALPKPWVPKILDPYFISEPSAIWRSFLKLGCLADKAASCPAIRRTRTTSGWPRSSP
jgi:NitT/TauT family transport system permease protein